MRTQVDIEELDVLHVEGSSLVDAFTAADQYGECTGVLRLSDGRRYFYKFRRVDPD